MDKKFRLPREFATKWCADLRSGKYQQVNGTLLYRDEYIEREFDYNRNNPEMCCLGVALLVAGLPLDQIHGELPLDIDDKNVPPEFPNELMNRSNVSCTLDSDELPGLLAGMNDSSNYTFEDIARFIETEIDLY